MSSQSGIFKRWTVSELTRYVREMFELDYRLQDVDVEGEISDLRIPGSGHAYFTLKDANAQLKCVMWRQSVQAQSTQPRHGDRIIARGYLSVYEASGQYQLYCKSWQPAGLGGLHIQFEALKAKLQAEGLFDEANKRSLPQLPKVIGIVTSPSAAALQDVLNVLRRRYPIARVILSPTAVQGEQAPRQIVSAIQKLGERPGVDVILVVRGGGSLEDLWCFNNEQVARAIAASPIPVVSGVGHEIDFTLADFAADLRAPTPSAAAELVTPVTIDDLRHHVQTRRHQIIDSLNATVMRYRQTLDRNRQALRHLSPQSRINNHRQALDTYMSRIEQSVRSRIALSKAHLTNLQRILENTRPERTLARGYAIVRGPRGDIVTSVSSYLPGTLLDIQLRDGHLEAVIKERLEKDNE